MTTHGPLILLAVVAVTTLAAVALVGRGGRGRVAAGLMAAVEMIGATALFFGANLAVGAALVLLVRRLTPYYPSLYEVSDLALLGLSLVQALVMEGWRRSR